MSTPLLFFPSEGSDWEIWTLPKSASSPSSIGREGATPDPAQAAASASSALVALPAVQCPVLALWLKNAEPSLLEEMIVAQLDKRGLSPRTGERPIFEFSVVAESEDRALVRVVLLPGNFPEALCFPKVSAYAASADFLPLPEGQLVLWRERQNLVVAAVRGGHAIYTQVLARSARITHETAVELRAIRFALELEQIVTAVDGVTVWGEFPEGTECLQALKLPVQEAARPAPSAPRAAAVAGMAARSRLVPAPLRKERARIARRKRNLRFAAVGVVAYFVLAFLLWGHLRSLRREALALQEGVQRDKPAAAELERAAAAWRVAESAVDPAYFAIEQFHRCAEVMPPVGIRFTHFELKGAAIQIRGNARNVTELFKYVEALKQAPTISRFGWRAGQPRVFQDNTAEFKIEANIR